MFGFTKQEQRYIFILIVSFTLGLSVDYYKKREVKTDKHWRDRQSLEIKELKEVTLILQSRKNVSTGFNNIKDKTVVLTKKSLVDKININTATIEELQLLPQIGPVLAQNIIEYRKKYGFFKTKEEIKNVKRIGQKTFNKIKMSITVK